MDKAVQPGGSAKLMSVFHALHAAYGPLSMGLNLQSLPLSCSITDGDILSQMSGAVIRALGFRAKKNPSSA